MKTMGLAASLPFFAGIVGYLFGGWLSDGWFKSERRIPVIVFQLTTAALFYLTYTVGSITMLLIYQTLAGFFLSAMLAAVWALPWLVRSPRRSQAGRSVFLTRVGRWRGWRRLQSSGTWLTFQKEVSTLRSFL